MFNPKISRFTRHFLFLPLLVASPALSQPLELNQDVKISAFDGAANDQFGYSVAISGTTAIIGARADDSSRGSAFLFDTISNRQFAKLIASDRAQGDVFGSSVSISGTTAIVGAFGDNSSRGAAYLFDTTTGQQIAKLTASDRAASDQFGFSVAISGNTAIVGAYRDDDNGSSSGSAYLFDTTTGQQIAKYTASDGAENEFFGYSVAISGTTAIVGAFGDQDNGFRSGSVYLFDTTTGQQIAKYTASDGAANDSFGISVAISGTTAIVGSSADEDNGRNSGSTYLFDTNTGQEVAKLTASDGAEGDEFGWSVALSGSIAIIGAFASDDNGDRAGSAYLFDTTTGQEIAKLTASDGAAEEFFGYSVAISGTNAIVGAYADDSFRGSAYLFDGAAKFVQQPEGDIVNVGDTVSFGVVADDANGVAYQWRRNGADLVDGGNISGATSATLTVVASESDEAFYDCVVTSIWGGVPTPSDSVILAILSDPNACAADLTDDGVLDLSDVTQFIGLFQSGCP